MERRPVESTLNEADATFSLIASRLDRFIDAWKTGDDPPELSRYLPAEPIPRKLALVELVKVDLEYRWQVLSQPKHISEYFNEFPELNEGKNFGELIFEEFQIRSACGLAVSVDDYVSDYPDREQEIRQALEVAFNASRDSQGKRGSQASLPEISVGQTIDDFELLAELGEGAFGKVFLARQQSMQRLVALKITAAQGDEPQTLAQFDHEQIVRVYDQRLLEGSDLRLMYMQYLPGGTLKEVITRLKATPVDERNGTIFLEALRESLEQRGESLEQDAATIRFFQLADWSEVVCWIGVRLSKGLDYAHQQGVLHRDIKPANVLLSRLGSPKLADFNISFNSADADAVAETGFGGSLAYMSPEQLEASDPRHETQPADLDSRSDLYSLGVVLWELLTGDRPFPQDQVVKDWFQTVETMARDRRSGVSEELLVRIKEQYAKGLTSVMIRCLEPDRNCRWCSGATLSEQFEYCLNPNLQSILYPPESGWSEFVRKHPVISVVACAAIPNLLAGAFNLWYNRQSIVMELGPEKTAVFDQLQLVINAIAYPCGLGLLAFLAFTITRNMGSGSMKEEHRTDDQATKLRHRCLLLGQWAAVIGVVEWLIAGFAYPITMRIVAGEIPWQASLHFWGSLLLCGLIAAAYPFFAITCLSVRAIYPTLLGDRIVRNEDQPLLERLQNVSWFYLGLAVAVPLLAILVLGAIQSNSRLALLAVCAASLIGLYPLLRCFGKLQADLAVFLRIHQDRKSNH